jgi:hypothetical protein
MMLEKHMLGIIILTGGGVFEQMDVFFRAIAYDWSGV